MTLGGDTLTAEVDYKVSANTATDAGTYFLTVAGQGNYGDSVQVEFKVQPKTVHVTNAEAKNRTYNAGTEVDITSLTFENDGGPLPGAGDWSATGAAASASVGMQSVTVTVTLTNDNFVLAEDVLSGLCTVEISTLDITGAIVRPGPALIYNGTEQHQTIDSVEKDGIVLATADYEVTNNAGTDADEYTLTITGKGNTTGTVELPFTIAKKTLHLAGATAKDRVYDGSEAVEVTGIIFAEEVPVPAPESYTVTGVMTDASAGTKSFKITVALNDPNYTLAETTLENAGTVTIAPKSIAGAEVSLGVSLTYNGDAQTQTVASVVLDGAPLAAENYTVSGNQATNAGEYVLTVTGAGNYGGEVQTTYTIQKKAVTLTGATAAGRAYDGTTAVEVTGLLFQESGAVPGKGDYTATGTIADPNASAEPKTVAVQVTLTSSNYIISATATTCTVLITPRDISLAAVSGGSSLTYNGTEQTQTIASVAVDGLILTEADYTVQGNTGTNAGDYVLTITGWGNYSGTAERKFTIAPRTVTVSGATAQDRVYDGTTAVTVTGVTFLEEVLVPAPESVTATGTLADPNASETAKPFAVTVTLSDSNYVLAAETVENAGTVRILKAPAEDRAASETIVAGSRTEDSRSVADLLVPSGALSGRVDISDPDGILRSVTASGSTMYYETSGNADSGDTATVVLTVTATNYADYTITVSFRAIRGSSVAPTETPVQTTTPTQTAEPTRTPAPTQTAEPTQTPAPTQTAEPTQTPAPAQTTDPAETTETTETKVVAETVVSGGAAVAVMDSETCEEIVRQAAENESSTVVIAPKVPEKITEVSVTIPSETVKDLGDNSDAKLRVETPAGHVTIPNHSLSTLAEAGDLTVTVEKTEDAVAIDVQTDGKDVIAVPIKAALELEGGQVAVLVDKDGNETVIPKSLVEDGKTYVILAHPGTVKVIDNSKHFEDVESKDWYADAVNFTAVHELFSGTAENTFDPDVPMSRAMLVTVLWKLESMKNTSVEDAFPDVLDDTWYADAVAWASANKLVSGTEKGTFEPDRAITRQEMAVMIYHYAVYAGMDNSNIEAEFSAFQDGESVSGWAQEAMEWAVANHILNGDGAGLLNPTNASTRAEVAAMMRNFISLLVK